MDEMEEFVAEAKRCIPGTAEAVLAAQSLKAHPVRQPASQHVWSMMSAEQIVNKTLRARVAPPLPQTSVGHSAARASPSMPCILGVLESP